MAGSNRYYEEELSYLVEAGAEYARLHPERARSLSLSDPRARDPHVERLIEAVAFLTGNIRQRLEDDFPELTHSLMALLWPHCLQPIPSVALLRFAPIPGMIRGHQRIPCGYQVESRGGAAGVACQFQTSQDVDAYPLELGDARLLTDDGGRLVLEMAFSLLEGADPAAFRVDRLRLFIAGEPASAYAIYRALKSMVAEVMISWPSGARRRLGPEAVRAAGFSEGEELLPYPGLSFPGFRLVSEYFAFPEKFHFIDLLGLGSVASPDGSDRRFTVTFRFKRRPPESFRPTKESFGLFITPIVNIFQREGEPVRVTQLKTSYRVLADATSPDTFEVISVDEVHGLRLRSQTRHEYSSFFSFEHDMASGGRSATQDGTYYHITHRRTLTGAWATYISLISPARGSLPEEEMLSLRVTATNGRVCQRLGLGDISVPAAERLDFVRFANITKPTAPLYPQIGEGSEWRFIAHMGLSFATLEDVTALRSVLSLYNIGNDPAHERRIDSLIAAGQTPKELVVRGRPVRGTEVRLTIDERHFDDEGDLLLFVEVLSRFLGLYAGVNAFTQLTVERAPSGEVLRCPAVTGAQKLL
jgi:type VI secretion system protein ImpG